MFGTSDGVFGLDGDRCQKELEPLLDLTALPNRLQAFVVLAPMLFEVGAQVKERRGQRASMYEEKHDE